MERLKYLFILNITIIQVITVMYKSLRASKSNYVKRLCLVVPLVSRP